jgi:hypothetical protein
MFNQSRVISLLFFPALFFGTVKGRNNGRSKDSNAGEKRSNNKIAVNGDARQFYYLKTL